METSAFDVLGSVLLGYLESVGEAVATNVEESGRSSAHVNAYDVLNAVEGCTAVAATQLRSGGVGAQLQPPPPGSAVLPTQQQLQQPLPQLDQGQMIEQATSGRGWEGLASFLFGSNWYSIPLEGEDTPKEDKDDKSSSTTTPSPTIMNGTTMNGGKGGPSTSTGKILPTTDKTTITTPTSANTKPVGGSKSGKGKQLANMTPPPGVSVVGNEVIMGNTTTTGVGTNEKNVSFSLLERKNSKGDSSSILLHGTTAIMSTGGEGGTKYNHNGPSSSSTSGRWDAPYLNEVAPFPLVTRTEDIANPHCLSGTTIALSMHDLATEQEACRDTLNSASSLSNKKQRRGSSLGSNTASSGTGAAGSIKDWRKDIADLKLKIPKDVFATKDIIWGSMKQDDDSNKKKKSKRDDNGNTHKTTTEDTSLVGTTGGPLPKLPAVKMPSYVPNFFPPFPRTEESISSLLPSVPTTAVMSDVMSRVSQKRKSPFSSSSSSGSGSNNNETVAAERNTVRHSLVELGKNAVGPSYWGSNWLNNNDDDDVTRTQSKEKLKINNTAGQLTVTPGPSSSASSGRPSDNNTNNKKAGGGGADAQVVPLARASGSRVAKILEGSN